MQGNLNEIDIRSILHLIHIGQRTGLLFVEDSNTQQSWLIFFLNGQIIYAAGSDSDLSQIQDYLRPYRVQMGVKEGQLASITSLYTPEYGYIWTLLQQNFINPQIARTVIHGLIQETLFDVLSLHQGNFTFQTDFVLMPHLTSLHIVPLLTKIIKQLQGWKQLYPYIQSPEQFPVLDDLAQLRSSLPSATVSKLQYWADGKTSLRQLARYLNRDILTVAKAIYPYVEQGWMHLLRSCPKESRVADNGLQVNQKIKVACIDAASICETVKSILQPQGYEAIAFTNSREALSSVFQSRPDLILCEITMPELSGYELCVMLRHSQVFRYIPIIMMAGEDKFSDRAKAKIVGATDYLTKPFQATELLMLVKKYVNYTILSSAKNHIRLVDPRQYGVKNIITE
jgi:twitching motility two-component system response regulator PilG